MDDFKVLARLLAAIRAAESLPRFDVALVDPAVLQTTAVKRDRLAIRLQKEGYVEGLCAVDGLDSGNYAAGAGVFDHKHSLAKGPAGAQGCRSSGRSANDRRNDQRDGVAYGY